MSGARGARPAPYPQYSGSTDAHSGTSTGSSNNSRQWKSYGNYNAPPASYSQYGGSTGTRAGTNTGSSNNSGQWNPYGNYNSPPNPSNRDGSYNDRYQKVSSSKIFF